MADACRLAAERSPEVGGDERQRTLKHIDEFFKGIISPELSHVPQTESRSRAGETGRYYLGRVNACAGNDRR